MSGYAMRTDGVYGWRAVARPEDCAANEIYSVAQPMPYDETPDGKIVQQKAYIQAQLDTIDAASSRPLRAIVAAQAAGETPAMADLTKLANLEAQAVALRNELASLDVQV